MDSITQIALGGVVGALVAGKKYGRKSVLIGALCGTLPDMDVLIPMGDPISDMTYHRGFSHSFLFAILMTPMLAVIFSGIKWFDVTYKDYRLHLMIFLALVTHMLLDSMTIYGTQLFWPLAIPPISVGSIFIIDLLYTIPLLIGMTWFLVRPSSRTPIKATLVVSSLYLVWSFSVQSYVEHIARQNIQNPNATVLTLASPFNTLLWRVVVLEGGGYSVGYYSIFDKNDDIEFVHYKSRVDLLKEMGGNKDVERLHWFNGGAYVVSKKEDSVVVSDIRMGREPDHYVFSFTVGTITEDGVVSVSNERYTQARRGIPLKGIWERIWDEKVKLQQVVKDM